ncbi:uncharacterized protein CDV56_107464 [Aspergillus thermomutatus]|uniref:Zn(2)-C6 fungal-type domain-containing protein n=1 Tax=Aspergillus thermomutatus TaxID=41047 RepID=A0A397H0I6_ASPTH|nr:uncharacterized protein CDV56_107464 [Aspergillus thermomutatus]RHZ56692.1 hypothetical protein CDV56_107464 [Aspergillus thermomutatus]
MAGISIASILNPPEVPQVPPSTTRPPCVRSFKAQTRERRAGLKRLKRLKCLPCTQQKIACNSEIPCFGCEKAGTQTQCRLPSETLQKKFEQFMRWNKADLAVQILLLEEQVGAVHISWSALYLGLGPSFPGLRSANVGVVLQNVEQLGFIDSLLAESAGTAERDAALCSSEPPLTDTKTVVPGGAATELPAHKKASSSGSCAH